MTLLKYCLSGILLCLALSCFSQTNKNEIRPLSIGDTIPADLELTNVINYPVSKIRISDLKGKLVILDFWATWCGSCLYHLPKLDSLQKEYNADIQVILVNTKTTGDDRKKISLFFENRKNKNQLEYQLPSVYNDSILDSLFPHQSIPHYAVLDKNGVVKAITASENITRKNISAFLQGKYLDLPIKSDITFDYEKPLFLNNNGGNTDHFIYRSFLTPHINGLQSSLGINPDYSKTKLVNRIFCTNASIYMLYCQAYPEIYNYPKSKIRLEVENPEKYTHEGDWSEWKHYNTYCYELIIPNTTIEQARDYMREDLRRFFGLQVKEEKKLSQCWIMTYDSTNKKPISKGGSPKTNAFDYNYDPPRYFRNYPFADVVGYLNGIVATPIIDETELKNKRIDLILPDSPNELNKLNEALNKYGFSIQEQLREIKVFVLSENKHEKEQSF